MLLNVTLHLAQTGGGVLTLPCGYATKRDPDTPELKIYFVW